MEKRKQLNKMKEFLASGNSTDTHLAKLPIDDVEASLSKLRYPIEYCKRRFRKYGGQFNKKGEPILRGTISKAEYVDKYNLDMDTRSESLAYIYHLVYRQLSSSVHLDGRNFPDFLLWGVEGYDVLLSGDVTRVSEVSELAIWLYSNLMRQFLKVYRIPRVRQMNDMLDVPSER